MSSPSDRFECRWQASRGLLAAYLFGQLSALLALTLLDLPVVVRLLGAALCLLHGAWVLPRHVVLTHPRAFSRLRRDAQGWHLWNPAQGWQSVQLCRDSLALPGLVLLRFRRAGRRWTESLCIPFDALEPVQHRRLRVRLKFSRRRWAAAE